MDRTAPYVSSRFKLTAQIGGVFFKDIVSFSSTFGLNMIPVATLAVATGREMNSGDLATIHEAKKILKAGDEAVVTLEITGGGGNTGKTADGVYTVFRGRYAGIGYKRSYNTAGYVLHLIHWLDDLNRGSMLNGHWMPGAPYDMAQNAGFYALSTKEGDSGLLCGVPSIDVQNQYITPKTIEEDFWDKVLREVFTRICDWPAPRWQRSEPEKEKAAREPVKAALERMSPRGPGKDWYKPLGLELRGINSMSTAVAIKTGIAKDAVDSFAYTTFWNKLVGEYAPQFFFAVSPSVDFALPVPFFAGLSLPHKLIFADEYNYADFNASVLQQLESVDIFYSPQNYSGVNIGELPQGSPFPSFKVPLGFYPENPTRRGFKMLKEPPTWMTNTFFGPAFVFDTTGDVRDCCSAEQVKNKPRDGFPGPNEATVAQQQNGAAMRFAEHYYKTEVLYQRHGEMSGKLRFDIAPGSIVAIETPPRDNEEQDILFATATQVSFAIDAERAAAGTSFTLAHIRTSEENADETLTSEIPPMYKTAWRGAPLAVRQ